MLVRPLCFTARSVRLALLIAVIATGAMPASAGAYVYWANYNLTAGTTIGRAGLDGLGADQSFITGVPVPTGMALDGRHVYWTSELAGTIGRANLDGGGADRFFITGATSPFGLAVDAQHVYWTNDNNPETIGRANIDGTGADQSFITDASGLDGLAVDGRHVYWANAGTASIGRADLDGSAPDRSFITGLQGGPHGLAVDGRHIYWTTDSPGEIGRANLDGTGVDRGLLLTGDANPRGVAVDGRYIYWANAAAASIGRANLDGSAPDPGFIVGPAPWGLAVDSLPRATQASLACSPTAPARGASTSCTVAVTDPAAGPSAPTGRVAFGSSGAGSFGSPGSCSLVATGAARSACRLSYTPAAAGAQTITAAYSGDAGHAPSRATASLTVPAAPPAKPSNSFLLGRPKLNKRKGIATLTATVPGPGKLLLAGRRIERKAKRARRAGKVRLTVKPRERTRRTLERTGRVKVTARVTYTPAGGDPRKKSKTLILKRNRHRVDA
jgi:sugar lactone lactonase YvrE